MEIEAAKQIKYFIFREDCYNAFVKGEVYPLKECAIFTVSKLVGYLILTGAFIIKLPQILKILNS